MKHLTGLAGIVAAASILASCASMGTPAPGTSAGSSYATVVEGYDWGPGISRIVIDTGRTVRASSLDATDFAVTVERKVPGSGEFVQEMDWATRKGRDSKGVRPVTAVYLSDARGEKSAAATGQYVTIAMKVGPSEVLSSPFNFSMATFLNTWVDSLHTITQTGSIEAADGSDVSGLDFGPDDQKGTIMPLAEKFDVSGVSDYTDPVYGAITLRYGSYAPKNDGKKHPLVIWLHGAGEGGKDPLINILGNRVTALVEDDFQAIFGGAYVLAPQTPIVWMNNGTKSYPEDGSTQYSGALMHLISTYVAANKDIDTSRIYLGGCSNGGYMTMNMIIRYPGYFAAAWPVCEAYADKWISDADIQKIKDIPIWFTHAKTDTTVKPELYTNATFARLRAAGAPSVHYTDWDRVLDLSGMYTQPNGAPYEYMGHWSWIHTLNNQNTKDADGSPVMVGGKAVNLFQWLASQHQ